ncbi:bioH [Wigglesworthia glossinidia endosymbiont of Glossina brevipalpis]|uniref:Pimeloyl-[acyl-carrier protein] methyl ester esterase n=1 Tax=Wigglesworthia glossinidia brevipalpis TaxID=36870 RepID=BIOH_WIGBR|nr:RecName: Full=Pimeloyl-[acyl-carrier protein] methyl ester esterase; AltName: Full=Biotin synthesis protein BioH; AltName: Full=Carboxylesterase BioH [Wigglesworthia glossinidia endosymbiont of Glossina brevipalpis]BAC24731.1 bioH [Wigglesworthia glossinidia endosymbiont of Glossina brevipalpis]
MKPFFWRIIGSGSVNLVFIHGWGLNSCIWNNIIIILSNYFKLHLVDLPGYGKNILYKEYSFSKITEIIACKSPKKSILIGWSLGGLIATNISIVYPEKFKGLIIVSSSPCFCEKKDWPGIKKEILNNFSFQLKNDFHNTVKKFFNIQFLGTKKNNNEIKKLKNIFFRQKEPSYKTLSSGLKILKNIDIRNYLKYIKIPTLRIYGNLDVIVPVKIIPIIKKLQNFNINKNIIIPSASHAPFLSHPFLFCKIIKYFIKKFN